MNAKQFEKLLIELSACEEGRKWAKGKTLKKVWETLPKANLMMWLLGKMIDKPGWPTRNTVIGLACDCAETVLPIWEKHYPNDLRVKDCLDGIQAFLRGEINQEDLLKLRRAAYVAADAAYAATYVAAAAAYAAYAAAYAAYAAADAAYAAAAARYADAAYAAYAAAAAAYAAAYAAADAAANADAARAAAAAANAAADANIDLIKLAKKALKYK